MTVAYIIHLANYSDGILYVLAALLLLLLTLAVLIDRLWFLRRTIMGGNRVVRATRTSGPITQASLQRLADEAHGLPEAAVIETALEHVANAHGEGLGRYLDEAVMLLAPSLDRRLWLLDTAITLAPLLGLFGTIIGMFHAFSVLAAPGHAPADVTAGVADALVATAFGIFIAMVGLAGYNALNNQVRVVLHQLDCLRMLIVNRSAPREAAFQDTHRMAVA